MTDGTIILAGGIGLLVIAIVLTIVAIVTGRKRRSQMEEHLQEWY